MIVNDRRSLVVMEDNSGDGRWWYEDYGIEDERINLLKRYELAQGGDSDLSSIHNTMSDVWLICFEPDEYSRTQCSGAQTHFFGGGLYNQTKLKVGLGTRTGPSNIFYLVIVNDRKLW